MEVLVSVITPVYNSEKYIEQTIKSVLDQVYKNWELLLINDCSNDTSYEIIKKISKLDSRIRIINNEINRGVSYSRNKGIEVARGKYILFLDSDDLWHKDKLKKQIEFMEKTSAEVSYTGYYKMDNLSNIRGEIKIKKNLDYEELLKNCLIGLLTSCVESKIIKKYKFKDIKSEDYVFWLEIIKDVKIFYGIEEPLAYYRVLEKSRSSNKLNIVRHHWYIFRKIEKLKLFKAIYIYIIYIIRGLKRYSV